MTRTMTFASGRAGVRHVQPVGVRRQGDALAERHCARAVDADAVGEARHGHVRERPGATISTVSFIAAGVGAGVALTGFFVLRPHAAPSTSATLNPWIGLGSAGVYGSF